MLQITIPAIELYDESKNEFVPSKKQTLQLEHSLVSISKWESKFCKPFLSKEEKTFEESLEYIRCMTLTQNVDRNCYKYMTQENLKDVRLYIEAAMTATTFPFKEQKINREIITAELIYYWMISMNIPFECQKWHLNKLLTLINVCDVKNQPPTKKSAQAIMERNKAMNEARRKEMNTKG